jgi:hypothetical protein
MQAVLHCLYQQRSHHQWTHLSVRLGQINVGHLGGPGYHASLWDVWDFMGFSDGEMILSGSVFPTTA